MSASTDRGIKEQLHGAAKLLHALARPLLEAVTFLLPRIIKGTKAAYAYYLKLPQNCLLFIYGFVFCFFGGTFPVLFAAIQAAEYTGRKAVLKAVSDLADEALIILEESKKDNEKDDDGDGKADVHQISHGDFIKRKTLLVLQKMNPEKVDKAISSIYKVWLAVAAVLSIEFARTISMALAIAEFLKRPIDRFLAPTIQLAVPNTYDKWVPVVLGWIAKSIAMSIAFYIQSVISGVTSALKGGLMMAQATYQFMIHRKIDLFGLVKNPDHTQSSFDEALMYLFAALGFYVQFKAGFSLPEPLNYMLFPFEIAEQWLRWSITNASNAQ